MTIYQILAVLFAGPVLIITAAQLIVAVVRNTQYTIVQALVLCISMVALLVAFLGVS